MADLLDDFLPLAAGLSVADMAEGERPAMLSLLRYQSDDQALAADGLRARKALREGRATVSSWVMPDASDSWHHPLGVDIDAFGPGSVELLRASARLCLDVMRGDDTPHDFVGLNLPCPDKESLAHQYAELLETLKAALGEPTDSQQVPGRGWSHTWVGDDGRSLQSFGHIDPRPDGTIVMDIQMGAENHTLGRARLGAFAPPTDVLDHDVEFTWSLGESSLPLVRLGGPDACERFHAAIMAFRASSKHGFCLMPWEIEQYRDHALYLTPDAKAGLAVGADGMLHSVFSTPGVRETYDVTGPLSSGDLLTALAIEMDAHELNCFDNGFTREFYERHGFAVTARFPFDPEQAIPGWQYGVYDVDGHEPDFLVMSRRAGGA